MLVMNPQVDILLVCFDQEQWIDQAIDSIFYQTNVSGVRVVVADDCSADQTLGKIYRRAKERSDIPFAFLPHDRHLGVTKNYQRAFSACAANYVAILEGDDYWASREKLAKQITFLEANPDCVMCGCNYHVFNEATRTSFLRVPITTGAAKYDAPGTIADNVVSNFSTSVYKLSAIRSLPGALFDLRSADWIVNICCGVHGYLGFLNEPLSFYRIHSKGVWSGLSAREQTQLQIDLIHDYDKLTEGRFHADFEKVRTALNERMLLV